MLLIPDWETVTCLPDEFKGQGPVGSSGKQVTVSQSGINNTNIMTKQYKNDVSVVNSCLGDGDLLTWWI